MLIECLSVFEQPYDAGKVSFSFAVDCPESGDRIQRPCSVGRLKTKRAVTFGSGMPCS